MQRLRITSDNLIKLDKFAIQIAKHSVARRQGKKETCGAREWLDIANVRRLPKRGETGELFALATRPPQ
jgi:hypothetical protein